MVKYDWNSMINEIQGIYESIVGDLKTCGQATINNINTHVEEIHKILENSLWNIEKNTWVSLHQLPILCYQLLTHKDNQQINPLEQVECN